MFVHLKNVLDDGAVKDIRAQLTADVWESEDSTAGTQSAQVKNNRQAREDNAQVQSARARVMQALGRHGVFFSAALPKRIFPPMFNRYAGASNSFGKHIDNAVRTAKDGGLWVRTDLSCTLFLSRPEDYEGGELVIEDGLGGRSVKLPAGDAILYPANTVHRVTPVCYGERLACFFWVESMVRATDGRQILFSMDQSISALRAQNGESAETVSLTGCYHNLMRLWADV